MARKPVASIAALSSNRVIGNSETNQLPWSLDVDFSRFLRLVRGQPPQKDNASAAQPRHSFVMGRNVFDEMIGYGLLPLGPGVHVVVSSKMTNGRKEAVTLAPIRSKDGSIEAPLVAVPTFNEAIEIASTPESDASIATPGDLCYVLGGSGIYREAMGRADLLRLTHIRKEFAGDVLFPELGEGWNVLATSGLIADTNNRDKSEVEMEFVDYVRKVDPELKWQAAVLATDAWKPSS